LLRLRGIAFEAIGKQLGMTKQAAHLLYKKALKLTPKADVEEMRKLEAERIADLRQRLWSRLAGRPDPADPTKTIQPTNDELVALVGQVIRLARHEAMVFGLDAPSKMELAAGLMGQAIDKEEIDIRLGRLTPQERDTFMMLIAKMDGRWVEPPALDEGSSVETTATTALSNGARS
jgi:hypothetical protein